MKSRRGSSSSFPPANPHFHPPPPSLSYDVSQPRNLPCTRVLRISTPRAISGIRKLLARNSIGVHSNSRVPYPLPVHTLVRCALASSCTSGKISVGYSSLETILRLSLIFVNKLVFLLRSSGER